MPRLSALFTNNGVPLVSPSNAPTIRIRRQDTGALVVTDAAMTEQGDGIFTYDFAETATLEYVFRCDGDPTAASQVTIQERYVGASFSGITEARIETDIPAILVDTDTTIPGLIAALNDLAIADVQTALTNQGYTSARAPNLDNLDATVSSRATQAQILADATPFNGADIAAILTDTGTTLPALIAALNDIDIADVQTALTNQGYTTVRAALIDNLDAAVSSRSDFDETANPVELLNSGGTAGTSAAELVADILLATLASAESVDAALSRLDNIDTSVTTTIPGLIAALNDIDISDVQTALTNQGYTTVRAALIDNLDAAISSRSDFDETANPVELLDSGGTAGTSAAELIADFLLATLGSTDTVDAALSRLDNMDTSVTTTIPGLIAALNDLSQADVQSAMTAQGYTTVRAALLDNLDASISSVITAISALNDLSIADVQTALTNQGYTTVRAPKLDNLDATVSSRATVAAILAAVLTGSAESVDTALSRLDNIDADAATAAAGVVAIAAAIAALNDISVAEILAATLGSGDTLDEALSKLLLMEQILRNRLETNPTTGKLELYNDASSAVIFSIDLWENVAGTQAYQGQGADRRDRIE